MVPPTVLALLSVILIGASASASASSLASASAHAPAPASFLWSWTAPFGSVVTVTNFVTPHVVLVSYMIPVSALVGLDVATGKQRWVINTTHMSACPTPNGCQFAITINFVYDNTTDLIFAALTSTDGDKMNVIAITSATGAIAYTVSVPADINVELAYLNALAVGPQGQLLVWNNQVGTLYAFSIAKGELLWVVNATNSDLCASLPITAAGIIPGPNGITITACGPGAYWAWDPHGAILWTHTNNGTSQHAWLWLPTFLADGSFVIAKGATYPSAQLCRYTISTDAYKLSWCATKPSKHFTFCAMPGLAILPSSVVAAINTTRVGPEFPTGLGSIDAQSGATIWKTHLANYTEGQLEPVYAVDPTGRTIYYTILFNDVLTVLDAATGTVSATFTLPSYYTVVMAVSSKVLYLADQSSGAFYAMLTQ